MMLITLRRHPALPSILLPIIFLRYIKANLLTFLVLSSCAIGRLLSFSCAFFSFSFTSVSYLATYLAGHWRNLFASLPATSSCLSVVKFLCFVSVRERIASLARRDSHSVVPVLRSLSLRTESHVVWSELPSLHFRLSSILLLRRNKILAYKFPSFFLPFSAFNY